MPLFGHFPLRAVLPKIQLSMFEKWVYTFGREVIVFSSRFPLVSGFHKLLCMCLQMCKELRYFKVQSLLTFDPSSFTFDP